MAEAASVRVLCRFRPINSRERREAVEANKDPEEMICKFLDDCNVEIFQEAGLGSKKYSFDRVYPPGVPQRDVYNLAANDTVLQVLNGYNGTILSYGQTGAGKSYSMFGADIGDQDQKGIIPRSGDHIFRHITQQSNPDIEWSIRCSFLEIYNESVNDLLARGAEHENLKIRESQDRGIYVQGAAEHQVQTVEDILTVIQIGDSNRAVSSTLMNAVSSRSHTVLMIFVQSTNRRDQSKQEGKMCLVDLAGSEKTSKTAAEGQRLAEANAINGSLTTLGQCIKMLADGDAKHIPFRQSQLTRLLQESLGGNSKTTLLIACSPHPFNREETISTCDFGKRAKAIKNKVKVNATKSVKELMAIIDRLQIQIKGMQQFIGLQKTLIEWYAANYQTTPGVYVPTEKDLQMLMDGKQIGAIKSEEGDGPKPEMDEEENQVSYGAINDASVRIAQLQSQLDKERENSRMMKEDFEADIAALERKLQSGNFQETSENQTEKPAVNSQDQSYEMKLLKAERDALKKQLKIAMGEEESSEYYYEEEEEDEKIKLIKAQTMNIGGKKVQELNMKIEEQLNQIKQLQQESELFKQTASEESSLLQTQIQQLKNDCNRLRGISTDDLVEDESLDEKTILIHQMEKEMKQLREGIMVLKQENSMSKFMQQRVDQMSEKFVKSQARVIELEDQLANSEIYQQVQKLEKQLNIKMQELATFSQRITISDQRTAHLNQQLTEVTQQVMKLRKDKQELIQQKNEDTRKLLQDFELQKQKLQENVLSKQKIYKPVQGTNVAQTLAATNPEILAKLKSFKARWVEDEQ